MGIFRILFGKKEKTVENVEETLDVLEQIKAEVKRLEEQWAEKEKEFALVNVNLYSHSSDTREGDYDPPSRSYSPNKHFKKLWKGFVDMNEKMLAYENYVKMLKEKEKTVLTKRDMRKMKKLRRLIHHKEKDAVEALDAEIRDFEQEIQQGKEKEEKYMHKLYVPKDEWLGGWEEESEEVRHGMKKMLEPVLRDGVGYDYDKRTLFFKHLEEECRKLRKRLRNSNID